MQVTIHSDKQMVTEFLKELKEILCDNGFDIGKNLIVIMKRKEQGKELYSTPYTLGDLDYDYYDVVERLKELTIEDYSETLFDTDDENPPLLFVFGKDINGKQVYIKLKIKGVEHRRILCLSFHYAEKQMKFPYA